VLVQQRLAMIEREVSRTSAASGGRLPPAGTPDVPERGRADQPPVSGPRATSAPFSELGAATYLGFEDRFRGTTRDIRERLAPYVPIFSDASEVLDVGCGRGELLELLRDHGIRAQGIDANQAMVDDCRAKGLAVTQADAQSFLATQPDAALGGLIAVQVIEHFEPAYLLRFLELAYLKLQPGAPLVLETINPACWMAFFEAYIRDLTHARPIHPDTLRYLVQATGFGSVNVEYRQPVNEADRLERVALSTADEAVRTLAAAVNAHADKLNARLFSSMDYAVIARR
jgi:O-antigen chain-terminating methyltransferase